MPRRWWWAGPARAPDGRVVAEFRLWDVFSGRQLAAQRFVVGQHEWRRLGHLVADQVYQRLTGEKGYFDTQIVFVDETGPKDRRNKRLAMMDQDGANVRLLSQGRELVLTPRFSPTSQEITFMQYTGDQPRVFLMNLETGKRELVGDFPGMTFAPRFSPDGQRIVMSIGEARPDRHRRDGPAQPPDAPPHAEQLPSTPAPATARTGAASSSNRIATGPSSSTSWARTAPASAASASARAATRRRCGRRAATSSPSPSRCRGSFLIGVMRSDGSGERVLTEGFHNEGPTWAPNGRVLMFFREARGAGGGPKLFSIDLTGYNERQVPTPAFGSDPAWSPLRN